MQTLRWTLFAVGALALTAFVALVFVGQQFRRGLGASSLGPIVLVLPLAVGGSCLLALALPDARWFSHTAAVLLALGTIFLLRTIAREAATDLWPIVAYADGVRALRKVAGRGG
jgi:hypothetical protein